MYADYQPNEVVELVERVRELNGGSNPRSKYEIDTVTRAVAPQALHTEEPYSREKGTYPAAAPAPAS